MAQHGNDGPPRDMDSREFVRLSAAEQRNRTKRSRPVRLAIAVSVGLAIVFMVPYGLFIVVVVAGLTAPAWSGWWRRN